MTGVATGVTGDALKEGLRNPSSGAASAQTELVSSNAVGYTARLVNINEGDGGALATGCRATVANEPCLTLWNLRTGRAFDITTAGNEAGRITTATASGKPFTTNATGVATGLNADQVDGASVCRTNGVVTLDDDAVPPNNPKILCTQGPFVIKGSCSTVAPGFGGSVTIGSIYLEGAPANSFVSAPFGSSTGFAGTRILLETSATTVPQQPSPAAVATGDTGFYVGAPGGSQLSGRLGMRVDDTSGEQNTDGTCEFVVGALT